MADRKIRVGQLISPFGPGAIYIDDEGTPLMVSGLDDWFPEGQRDFDLNEFLLSDSRLLSQLGVGSFRKPPDFRERAFNRHFRGNGTPQKNERLTVPARRFPGWYRSSETFELRKFELNQQDLPNPGGNARWLPVRFVAVCPAGHIADFPWAHWIGCRCSPPRLFLYDHGGADLASIIVECKTCGEKSSLAGAMRSYESDAAAGPGGNDRGMLCSGKRPWLGLNAQEPCGQPLVGALISQTNLYFPKVVSSIDIPNLSVDTDTAAMIGQLMVDVVSLSVAKTYWKMGREDEAIDNLKRGLGTDREYSIDLIRPAFEKIMMGNDAYAVSPEPSGLESGQTAYRRAEYAVLREPVCDEVMSPGLKISQTDVPRSLSNWIGRIRLVERLRETRVFAGFSRIKPSNEWPVPKDIDSVLGQLFLEPPAHLQDKWLPGISVYGEGLYLELNEQALVNWQAANRKWLEDRVAPGFVGNLANIPLAFAPVQEADRTYHWATRYLLVHSLAHLLINQLIFESGYGTASLRERLYVSNDPRAPMAGILIYTAAGDSEGTLGGLVRLGHTDRFEVLFNKAISRASWCSADPVCSEVLRKRGGFHTNLAACNACLLLPETCCETGNRGLDRAMVVGTPRERAAGFFSELVNAPVELNFG